MDRRDFLRQIRLYPRGSDPAMPDAVVANVWDWDKDWKVVWYEDGARCGEALRRRGHDPSSVELHRVPDRPARRGWVEPYPVDHLFVVPASAAAREITVEGTDRFGRVYTARLSAPAPTGALARGARGGAMATAAQRATTVLRFFARAGVFAVTVAIWHLVAKSDSSPLVSGLLIVGPIVLIFPVVWLARRLLDARPTVNHAAKLNGLIHFALMVLFGVAIVEAVQTGQSWQGWTIPVPARIGLALVWGSGLATILTVVNLAVRGLGAPFAIALSRRLATDWMYRWTRNPMVLAVLAFLASFGVWVRSTLFLLWVLLLVAPAWLYFLKTYEERELEIRFGTPYLEYKSRTPMLLPGRPRR